MPEIVFALPDEKIHFKLRAVTNFLCLNVMADSTEGIVSLNVFALN